MQRRQVLAGLILAFGCTPSGREIEEVPPPEDEPAPEPKLFEARPPFLGDAALAADDGFARRPLLVFVIPEDEGDRWRRGRVFGELLNYGDDASLAPLALFEVRCAPMSTLRATYPGLESRREPWLVVVDRTRFRATATLLVDRELDELAAQDVEKSIDARMARLAQLFDKAADLEMIGRLADLEESALPQSVKDELVVTTRDFGQARISVASAAAGMIYRWGLVPTKNDDTEWARDEMKKLAQVSLAAAARDRLVRSQPPKGAHWGRSGGCGVVIEGARSQAMVGCGMGHVPERSRRFLSFYAEEDAG